jgi:predicted nuclease of restriction endonuclease-like RecB superfamily
MSNTANSENKIVRTLKKIFNRRSFSMSEPARVSPEETRQKVVSGSALLVCAYDNEEKFRKLQLEGATSLSSFRELLSTVPKNKEVIFYCA